MNPHLPELDQYSQQPRPNHTPVLVASAVSSLIFLILGFLLGRSFPSKPPVAIATPTPTASPAANWQTYTNLQYNFVFNYPLDFSITENDNTSAKQYIVNLTKDSETISLDIQFLTSPISQNYLGFIPASSKLINGLEWAMIEDQTYCDAGDCSGPFTVYQTIKDNTRYAFIIYQNSSIETLNQILSTFRFTDQANTPIDRTQATEFVKNQSEVKQWLTLFKTDSQSTPHVVVEDEDAARFTVRVYESFPDHLATFNWYYVSKTTGTVTKEF